MLRWEEGGRTKVSPLETAIMWAVIGGAIIYFAWHFVRGVAS